MSQRLVISTIYTISLIIAVFSGNLYLKMFFLITLFSIIIYFTVKNIFTENSNTAISVIGLLIMTASFILNDFKPFKVNKKIVADEYSSFGKDQKGNIVKFPYKITISNENGAKLIKLKDDSSFLIKKEYKKNIKINNLKFNIKETTSYNTGNYIIYIKSNITKESFETVISNNGNIKLDTGKIEMIDKKEIENIGKAIQIRYSFPGTERNYEQWLYKNYKEFNMITSSDDPLTILYADDEKKNIYNLEIEFKPPFQLHIQITVLFLSLIFVYLLFWRKSEDKIL